MRRLTQLGDHGMNGRARTKPPCRRKARPQRKLAIAVGSVGAFVLALSVWEVTTELNSLTGMPYVLAALLAVGLDGGVCVCELASVAAAPDSDAYRWAERYIRLAVGLSVVLNATAAASHAEGWLKRAAVGVGGVVPVFVFIAGRVAGALWTGK